MSGTFLCKILFLVILSRRQVNSIEVDNTPSPVTTRTGCQALLTCAGLGTSIEWTMFGAVAPLEENENLSTHTEEFRRGNSSPPYWVANLSITVYPAINNQRFQCFLRGSPPGARTITHQVLLRVDPEVVAIEPIDAQWDLSSYHIGSNITIGCSVKTCAEQISVQFLKGASVVKKYLDQQGVANSAYVLTLPVSEDIVGMYACKVDTTNADHSAMQYFEIIGTPKPPLPTTAPPTTEGTTRPTNTGGGDNQNGGGDGDNNSAVPASYSPSLLATTLLTTSLLLFLLL
ncbi:hypothetical protein GBAR_LOCUS19565 [Geodia barretti]|uniref:Ig-like domain-containing protein n=1 Tax=Geodia barretti TaxID=519541 RepID=A0AA35WVX9_GEOBA|nr:hypothetical protein GBAR_LOCUS19565 [Geodia barretti]